MGNSSSKGQFIHQLKSVVSSPIFYQLIIFLITLILTIVFLKDVGKDAFLFIHDEVLMLTKQESFNSFFVRNPTDLGLANTTILIVTFFDRLYYLIVHYFALNLQIIQRILYFIKIFTLIFLPYLGFKRLSRLYLNENADVTTFIVSLWYSFNTFTLIYWHGNAFSLTLIICYSLAPLALYYYHKSIFEGGDNSVKLKAVLLIFLMSFTLIFFPVFVLLLIIYTLLYLLLNKIKVTVVLKNLSVLAMAYLPFIAIHFLMFYDMLVSVGRTINVTGGETYGNLQGGLLYQLLMWFSWAIYTYWEPRNIYTFHSYFKSIPSLIAPFIIYGLLIYGAIKKKRNLYLTIFLFLFLFLLLFVKGGQGPFGELYLFLINNFSPFRVFRSPDNKFGFGIVFIISTLLLIVSKEHNKKIFITLLIAVILIQGFPLFSGIAIKGENTDASSDRIIHITKEYQELADFINKNPHPYGYVMTFPSVEFGHYRLDENERYIGQDLLPKLTHLPHLYIPTIHSGMFLDTCNKLSNSLKMNNIEGLKEFPIRYLIIRYDLDRNIYANEFRKFDENFEDVLSKEFRLAFENKLFRVYENTQVLPTVRSENITFEMISPVKYRILFKNINNEQKLYFYQSYHSDWKLYLKPITNNFQCDEAIFHEPYKVKECSREERFAELNDISYILRKPIFDNTHEMHLGYANSWLISPEPIKKTLDPKYFKINPDNSIDFELVLYFKTQSIFYSGAIISMLYLFLIPTALLVSKKKRTH